MSTPREKDPTAGRGTFLAIALCVGFYLAWTQYLNHKYPGYNTTKTQTTEQTVDQTNTAGQTATTAPATQAGAPAQAAAPVAAAEAAPKMTESDLVIDTPDLKMTFAQNLASPVSVSIKNYRQANDPGSPAVELLHRPLAVQTVVTGQQPKQVAPTDYAGSRSGNTVTFTRQDGPWKIIQQWDVPATGYAGKLSITWTNTSAEPLNLKPAVLVELGANVDSVKSSFFSPGSPNEAPRFLSQADGSDDFKNIGDFCSDQALEMTSTNKKLDFFGIDAHYFVAALIPNTSANYRTTYSGKNAGICEILTTVSTDLGSVAPGQAVTTTWDTWLGPKDVELLTAFNPHLKTTLGLGWLDMIASPLLLAIKGLYKFFGNYGVAIIVLTLLLKILFYPLARQAAISAARMKKLNPEMTKIREKHKANPQQMQMELMKFMSVNKINPMKGCLPILPQIPVFFALFRVLSASIDLRHAPFYGWITDLSAKDPYLVTPLILTGFMFIQQRLTPMTGMDKNQEKIMMFMPLIFGVMMISLPSGLVLYMLTNTIVSIAQQQYITKKIEAQP